MTPRASGAASIRAQRRAVRNGSGPAPAGYVPPRNPGAHGAFALLGEVLQVGILVTLLSLPVVTLPLALGAGVRHLRRYVGADDSRLALFWDDLRRGLPGGLAVGFGVAVLAAALLADVVIAGSGALPGGEFVAAAGWIGIAALATAVLAAVGEWDPDRGWRAAIVAVPARIAADPAGAAYLLATAGFVAIVTWVLAPLIVPSLGCAALAVVAVPHRARRAR